MQLESADLAARFAAALERLTGGFAQGGDRLLVAVSGGPDSLALLLLAARHYGGRVCAATVDHGLRADSAEEAAMVARMCAARDVPHSILRPAEPIKGNLQSEARRVRYALLRRHAEAQGVRWIATAHHADDQLETVLMRLARGAGLDGMAAIRACNGAVIRPLLDMRKAELVAYCAAQGVAPVDDPSNRNRDFDRVRMREALAGQDDADDPCVLDPRAAVCTAAALAQSAEALDWAVDRLAGEHVVGRDGWLVLSQTDFPPEILRRLVLQCLVRVQPGLNPRGRALADTLAALAAGETRTLGNVLCQGGEEEWSFRPAPPRHGEKAD